MSTLADDRIARDMAAGWPVDRALDCRACFYGSEAQWTSGWLQERGSRLALMVVAVLLLLAVLLGALIGAALAARQAKVATRMCSRSARWCAVTMPVQRQQN